MLIFVVPPSFLINHYCLFDDTALVADSEEKLCRVVSEFRRVCVVLSTWGRKWQLMEDVKGMWYIMNQGYRA